MRAAAILSLGLTLAAGTAQALVIEGCPDGDAAGTTWEVGPYSPSALGNGFTHYGAMEMASEELLEIVEHCSAQRQFVWRRGVFGSGDPLDMEADILFDQMLFGEQGYTLDEMADALRSLGERVEIRSVGYISCACILLLSAGEEAGQ